MMKGRVFTYIIVAIFILAGIERAASRDIRMMVYYFAAAVLNGVFI